MNSSTAILPRIIVVDDYFGRVLDGRPNPEREDFCAQFRVRDASADASRKASRQQVRQPVAEAVFLRGQTPALATTGDTVENDLDGTLQSIRRCGRESGHLALALVDLSFATGRVTTRSEARLGPGMPEGRAEDDEPGRYFGMRIVECLRRELPELPVVVLSGRERGPVSREFSELGALAFLPKGDADGASLLRDALFRHGLVPDASGAIVGTSSALLQVLRGARRVGPMRHNLLLLGERGVGKDLLARYINRIHRETVNAKAPMVILNSSVLTPELFASELFGIADRTATGVGRRSGLVQEAHHGDLFVDEVKDASPVVQAGLLRVLEERRVTPVGSRKSLPVDVRFLSATNADLEALSESGQFRHDLLDRLREGGSLRLPPLRERPEDISLLAERFIRDAEATVAKCQRREITPESLEMLKAHAWPGNIRELRNCLHQAVSAHPDVEHLVPAHLRLDPLRTRSPIAPVRTAARESPALESATHPAGPNGIHGLSLAITAMESADFPLDSIAEWAGALPRLQQAQHRLLARCAEAALRATVKRTPERPEGQCQIHPAGKLLCGDPDLTATKAADLFKKILGPMRDELDGFLAEAYETAIRLRPKNPNARPNRQ
jgi:DNA-binding NtrC family response regulator